MVFKAATVLQHRGAHPEACHSSAQSESSAHLRFSGHMHRLAGNHLLHGGARTSHCLFALCSPALFSM